MTSSKTRRSYSAAEKLEIIEYAMTTSQGRAAHKFGVHKSMISRWTRRLGKIRSAEPHTRRIGSGRRPWKIRGHSNSDAGNDDEQSDDEDDYRRRYQRGGRRDNDNDSESDDNYHGSDYDVKDVHDHERKGGDDVYDKVSSLSTRSGSVSSAIHHTSCSDDAPTSRPAGDRAGLLADMPMSPVIEAVSGDVLDGIERHDQLQRSACVPWNPVGCSMDRTTHDSTYQNQQPNLFDGQTNTQRLFMEDGEDDESGGTNSMLHHFQGQQNTNQHLRTMLQMENSRFNPFNETDLFAKSQKSLIVDQLRTVFDFGLDTSMNRLLYEPAPSFSLFDGFDLSQTTMRVCNNSIIGSAGHATNG